MKPHPDSEVGGIVLVLVLDLWDFGAEKRAPSFANHFVPSLRPRLCRVLEDEQEHEHESSTSAFRFLDSKS